MKTSILVLKRSISLIIAFSFVYAAGIAAVPLKLYYSAQRTDNFTTSTVRGGNDALKAGYRFAGIEGYVEPIAGVGRRPLKLYYHPGRKDNFLTSTREGDIAARAAGYRFVGVEGYLFATPGRGRKALKLFYHPQREDNFTTATAVGERNARRAGYRFVRIEGYVLSTNKAAEPTVRDHRNTSENTRDHRTSTSSGIPALPGLFPLPEHLRPAFNDIPIWRLQLKVTTDGRENAGTDDEVFVRLRNNASIYYLDRAGDDRERNKTNIYDIVDPGIRTIDDIKMLMLSIKGDDGWCVKSIELKVNNWGAPIFRKSFNSCKWLDNGKGKTPTIVISGRELRAHQNWRYNSLNRAIWLPPSVIKKQMLEEIVESYVGHMMNEEPELKHLEYGKKYGRAYVEAKPVSGNKLHFDLDLAYTKGVDLETDVDFDMIVLCQNNKLSLQVENVRGKLEIPLISRLVRLFKEDFAKMKIENFDFQSQVPLCPSIRVESNGDISLRL